MSADVRVGDVVFREVRGAWVVRKIDHEKAKVQNMEQHRRRGTVWLRDLEHVDDGVFTEVVNDPEGGER